MKYTIENRYSETELPDKQGRWARIVYANDVQIAWIKKSIFQNKTYIYVTDFFPSLKNDIPCYSEIELKEIEEIIEGVKKRFEEFISKMNETN